MPQNQIPPPLLPLEPMSVTYYSQIRLDFPVVRLLRCFPTKILYEHFISPIETSHAGTKIPWQI
jgi:hypothetical protein